MINMTLLGELPPPYDEPATTNRRNIRRRTNITHMGRRNRRIHLAQENDRTLSTLFLTFATFIQKCNFGNFFAIITLDKDERCCQTQYRLSLGPFIYCTLLISLTLFFYYKL